MEGGDKMRTRRYNRNVVKNMKEIQVGEYIKIMRGRKILAIVDWMEDDKGDYLYIDIGKESISVPKNMCVVIDDDTQYRSGVIEVPIPKK
jgi:hypothetical protein